MKKLYLSLSIFTALLVGFVINLSAGPGWTYTPTTTNHSFMISGAQFNGANLSNGDYVGAFYTDGCDLLCAGYITWNGAMGAVITWGDNPNTPQKDGLLNGETIIWKLWRLADATEYFAAGSVQYTFTQGALNQITSMPFSTIPVSQIFHACVDYSSLSCGGICSGSAQVNVSGGIPPYGYSWSTGATSSSLTGLCAGTYTVTVSDQFGTNTQPVFDWSFVTTSSSHIISVPINGVFIFKDTLINGVLTRIDTISPVPGDFIGAFYDSSGVGACGGYIQWTGSANSITVRGDNGLTPGKEGFVTGEAIQWRYWNSTGNFEVLLDDSLKYNTMFPQQGNFTSAGISALLYMAGSYTPAAAPIVQDTVLSFVLTEPTSLQLSWILSDFNGYQVSSFGASDGFIDLSISGGVLPYTYSWSNGSTTQDIAQLPAGNYSVTVTDANQCTQASGVIQITQAIPLTPMAVAYTQSDEICAGSCDGSIHLQISDGVPPYLIQWSNGATSADLINICPGSYSVTVLDQSGNSADYYYDTFVVAGNPALSLISDVSSYGNYQISSFGMADGYIHVTSSGGAGTLTMLWSNGQTSSQQDNLIAGTYSVTVSDTFNCSLVETFILSQPAQVFTLMTQSTVNAVTCNGSCNGSIQLAAYNTIPPYYYLWSNGATGANLSGLCTGTYTVTISDSNFPAGGGTPFNWSYSTGGTSELMYITGGTVKINGVNILTGSYIGAFYLDGETLQCSGYLHYTGASTTFSLRGDNPSTQQKDGFISGDSIYWKVWRAQDSISINMTPIYASTGNNPGLYTPGSLAAVYSLSGTYIPVSNTNPLIQSYNIVEPTPFMTSISQDAEVSCHGEADAALSVNFSGGVAPYLVTWSTGSLQISINGLASGLYSLTATDANSCQDIKQYQLTQPDALSLILFPESEACYFCSNGTLDADVHGGTAPYSYEWSVPGTGSGISGLAAGEYHVTVSDAHQCSLIDNVELFTEAFQRIQLPQGWSYFAPFVDHSFNEIDSFLAPIMQSVILVKDSKGRPLIPSWNLNLITEMTPGFGYSIQLYEPREFFVAGTPYVPESLNLSLPYGWSIICYPRMQAAAVDAIFQAYAPFVHIVKNSGGGVFWPTMSVNSIGMMMPGEVYQIRMLFPQQFTYPAN